ncbi:MAG TPA: chemotaxis protein CheW, partial [Gemmataceae bacterium]|nr:chemotaxis protein CheW [Gemmataceae bacterium]
MSAERSLIYEFVSEAKEHLANVSDDLLALEQHKGAPTGYRIDRLFRAVHSVKGGAGFFGCRAIEALAHAMETVLDRMREEALPPETGVIDALLAGTDRILTLLDDVERSDETGAGEVVTRLEKFFPPEPAAPSPSPVAGALAPRPALPVSHERPAGQAYLYEVKVDLVKCHKQHGRSPYAVLQQLQTVGTILDGSLDVAEGDLDAPLPTDALVYQGLIASPLPPDRFGQEIGLAGVQITLLDPAPEATAPPAPACGFALPAKPQAVPEPPLPAPSGERSSIRIPVQLLDRLMTLAGELVLVRNQSLRSIDPRDAVLRPVVQRLDAITSELQGAVLLTRMQPVGNLFGRFPRMVRDLARQLGKEIELETSGTEVELDKTILEALSDPLTHLIRNSCDHGIETPAERLRAGKVAQGKITLAARHLGGQIYLEVRDDGKGIDPQAIKGKALQLGLKTSAELARLGERELLNLILLPGFSTAPEVTDLSGRGVGMDVVKTNISRLGGALEMDSEMGRGTTFLLRLPLTLAIIPCLLVGTAGQRYAIPQRDLEELVCLVPEQVQTRIEYGFDQEMVRLRERLLPLVRLTEVLQHPAPFTPETRAEILARHRRPAAGNGQSASNALLCFAVVKVGSRRFGLIVDEIFNTEEIVVKPMHGALQGLACFSGATILGDGRVALILSSEGIARHVGVQFEAAEESVTHVDEARAETQTVLLFKCGSAEQFGVPLAMIRRLQMVDREGIERVGGHEFLTVDGVSTRVVRPDRFLDVSPLEERKTMVLLLPRNLRRPMGILVSAILDTEMLPPDLNAEAYRADGLIGSALVRGRMTLLLDVHRLADLADPGAAASPAVPAALPGPRRRVLLVEDTQFFRELVRGYLQGSGYEVVSAP